jgi:hypothetical protein
VRPILVDGEEERLVEDLQVFPTVDEAALAVDDEAVVPRRPDDVDGVLPDRPLTAEGELLRGVERSEQPAEVPCGRAERFQERLEPLAWGRRLRLGHGHPSGGRSRAGATEARFR